MTLRLVFEWLSLILLIGLGVYTMWVIKNEQKAYIKNARVVVFKQFKLFTPTWWGEIPTNSEDELCFKRLDTRYDWEARFIWNSTGVHQDLIELFKEHIHQRKILFDEETSIIYNPTDFRDSKLITSGLYEMVRLEGTATADRQDRLYYDAFLIREIKSGRFLYAESKSSILNGLVEGPYFEAVMTRLELVE
ncbi:MAG: hypothetical protein PHY93_19895 [Bacteriovorax sp.]|nr:hypothetical protein [Bacteriovorax sp.]